MMVLDYLKAFIGPLKVVRLIRNFQNFNSFIKSYSNKVIFNTEMEID